MLKEKLINSKQISNKADVVIINGIMVANRFGQVK